MEDHDRSNPVASVDALVSPSPLTIARFALLSRVNSPVIYGIADDVGRNLEALYLTSIPVAEAARHVKTAVDDALVWAEETLKEPGAYTEKMCALLNAVTAFWNMLPNPDPKKKASGTETAG